MNLNTRHLRAFVATAEAGRFTRAAERLGVSQSSISESVGILEELLGLRLFDRHTRMLRLTEAGAEVLPQIQRLLAELDRIVTTSGDISTLERGHVSIAAPSAQSAIWLPRLMSKFSNEYPNVQISLYDIAEQEVRQFVRSGQADIGICTASDIPRDLRSRPFYSDSYTVAVHPEHPLAHKRDVTWNDLVKVPVIGPLAQNPVRVYLDQTLAARNLALNYRYEVSLPWTMVGLVQSGLGVAVLTDALKEVAEWMKLVVRPIHRPWIRRNLTLVTQKDRALSPSAARFFQLIETMER
jgi:LysR family carnitine catabolism transcriptional activator